MSAPARPAPHVSVANHKGGVGKTGVAQGITTAAAEAGHRVLVVDMDAQGN
ncbi:ParA family protein, partial [Streptomyces sp. NRRL S-495]|uniref:ParA family protein n=1 Tax=Streptomyces sp. NRRL S-495 TaxID=1609133 RepID=UPI0005F91EFC